MSGALKKFVASLGVLSTVSGCANYEQSKTKHVIGHDDRVSVNAGAEPWTVFGRLDITFPQATGHCSGTLVGRDLVLTAAHCVYSPTGQEAQVVDFSPVFEYGNAGAQARMIDFKAGVIDFQSRWADDWAVIKLDRPIGDDYGWIKAASFAPDDIPLPMTVDVAGYSSDIVNGDILLAHFDCQLKSRETGSGAFNNVIDTDCDLFKGASGASLVQQQNGAYVAIGVVSHQTSGPGGHKNGVAASAKIQQAIDALTD